MSDYAAEKLTPRAIVEELDRYIVGQKEAKRAVAIALRNRWRRQQLPANLRDEIAPKNILLAGPTGVGKTEIARRLARLAGAPFLKVEASKFTEVGYVGRDVDSIVRDLMEVAIHLVKEEAESWVADRARDAAENRILDELAAKRAAQTGQSVTDRQTERERLRSGLLDSEEIELQVSDSPQGMFEVFSAPGVEQIGIDMGRLQQMFSGGRNTKTKRMRVNEALSHLTNEETQKLIDMDRIVKEAIHRAEESGIVFLDEIDKIADGGGRGGHGPDISREGVQRDLLPIVEGSSVTTKYGVVKTDHVLFIAAGAFHVTKPSDLIPELQGRFPIRVQLEALSGKDLVRILTEPEHSLTRQYEALLGTEGVRLEWKEEAILEIARLAEMANDRLENIGARRLHTMLERLLEEVSFDAAELRGAHVPVTASYVRERLGKFVENEDLSRYIL